MTLEEQVQEAVDYFVRDVPPRHDLADVALRRARRRRRRRWLSLTGGTALAVATTFAVMMADPLGMLENTANEIGPADISPPDDRELEPPEQRAETWDALLEVVDPDALPTSPAPDVPWMAGDELHLGGRTIRLDTSDVLRFEPVTGGVAVLSRRGDEPGLDLAVIHADGTVTELGSGDDLWPSFSVSANGELVAWSEAEFDDSVNDFVATTMFVADMTTGQVIHEKHQTGADGRNGVVRGFVGEDRLAVDMAGNSEGTFIWDLRTNTVSPWLEGYTDVLSIAHSGNLGAFGAGTPQDFRTVVLDIETGQELWSFGGQNDPTRLDSFSPDGRYAALWASGGVVIADARTGHELVTFKGGAHALAWEADGALIIVTVWPEVNPGAPQSSLVRCSVQGMCELATGPRLDIAGLDDGQWPTFILPGYW